MLSRAEQVRWNSSRKGGCWVDTQQASVPSQMWAGLYLNTPGQLNVASDPERKGMKDMECRLGSRSGGAP